MSFLASSLLLVAAIHQDPAPNQSEIQTLAVSKTAEAQTIMLRIALPKDQQLTFLPVDIQFRIDGFALGVASQFERASELINSKMGQTVHVIIDEHPYFPINGPAIDPFDESGYFYNMSYRFQIPFQLSKGMHTIRMFPARSWGESLKGDHTYVVTRFYVDEVSDSFDQDLSGPYITYNEPSPYIEYSRKKPVLLDFYLTNVELSPNGYKIRLKIDGTLNRYLTSWQPYYIFGLQKGSHLIQLELLDPTNKPAAGKFNKVAQTITVY